MVTRYYDLLTEFGEREKQARRDGDRAALALWQEALTLLDASGLREAEERAVPEGLHICGVWGVDRIGLTYEIGLRDDGFWCMRRDTDAQPFGPFATRSMAYAAILADIAAEAAASEAGE